jgi:nicotinamidase-related amidase
MKYREAMHLTAKSALVVIDMQVVMYAESDPVYQGDTLLTTIQTLIKQARTAGVPVIYVRHDDGPGGAPEHGTAGWAIHPAIAPLPDDIIIDKRTPDSFHETALQQELERRGISKLILTGIQTECCVDTTCRRASSLGYDVTLVSDAHSTWNSKNLSAQQIIDHHNGVLPLFAKVRPSTDITF